MKKTVVSVLLALAALAAATREAKADRPCTGEVGDEVIDDNIFVPRGQTCVLNGTHILGNARVEPGALLLMNGAHVYGNVQADQALGVVITDLSHVYQNVQSIGSQYVLLLNWVYVGANVQIRGGYFYIVDAQIREDVQCLETVDRRPPGFEDEPAQVAFCHVGENVQIKKHRGALRVAENNSGWEVGPYHVPAGIGEDLQLEENTGGPFEIFANDVGEDLQFFKNRGPGSITFNVVGGNLQVRENTPRPTVADNVVRGNTEIDD